MTARLTSSDFGIEGDTLSWQGETRLLAEIVAASPRPVGYASGLATAGFIGSIGVAAAIMIAFDQMGGSDGAGGGATMVAVFGAIFVALVAASWALKRWAMSPDRKAEIVLVVENNQSALLPMETMAEATKAADTIMAAVAHFKLTAPSADTAPEAT